MPDTFHRLLRAALALALVPVATYAQEPARQPTFRSGVDLVRVDVIVTDRRGRPVGDLAAADFEVSENGVRQQLASAEFVSFMAGDGADQEPRAPLRDRVDVELAVERGDRLFVIFLDEYHVLRGRNTLLVREALAAFVRTELGPNDIVAVMYPFTSIFNLRFTRDKASVSEEILKFEGRADDFMPRRPIEAEHNRDVRRLRNEVVLSALAGLATHLQSYGTSRKTVVLASEGMSDGGWRSQGDFYRRLQEIFVAANRANTAFYPLDPTGVVGMRAAADALHVLATQTSGVALINRNDLHKALEIVSRDAGAYYLLGYYPSESSADGKWRDIKVRVRRSGTDVRWRKGYAALTAEEVASRNKPVVEPPREATEALAALASPRSGRILETWVGYEMSSSGSGRSAARVLFAWTPASLAGSDPVTVSIVATGADKRECFRGESKPGAERGGHSVFDVPATGEIGIAIEARAGGLTYRDKAIVAIPDPATTSLGLDTPRIFRTRTAQELQRVRENPDEPPAIGREFRRKDRLLIRTGIFGTASADARFTAQLLTRAGRKLADLSAAATHLGAGKYLIDLPLSNFAAGEFLLEVRAAAGRAEARELIAFRILAG